VSAEHFVPQPGAVRYFDEERNTWQCANPRDMMFSTVTMLATEYWADSWRPIFDNADSEVEK
jgi:hypothetical protein